MRSTSVSNLHHAAARWLTRPSAQLGLVLVLAAALRGWRMADAGFGTPYYAAGVLSMGRSWPNFLFNAFDPAGFLALDKPPLAFWPQVLAAKLIGFGPVALHLPQMLEGVAACALLWHLVARRFGERAGLLATLILAVTPISVAVDRTNNTDSLLVLVMLLATWPLMLAAEQGRRGLLLASALLFGIAFNVKMLAALLILPAGALLYLCAAPIRWPRRIGDLLLAGGVLATVALSWPLLVEATPPDARPYVDSTQRNSVLELAVDHNAIDRFIRPGWLPRQRPEPMEPAAGAMPAGMVPAGIGRLFDPRLAGQVAWLLPLAIAGVALAIAGVALAWRMRRPGLGPEGQATLFWGGWALLCWLVYSAAGGIFLPYYLAPLAPPLAALAAIGAARLSSSWAIGMALVATAAWQGWLLWSGDGPAALMAAPAAAALLVAGLLALRRPGAARTAGTAALLIAPLGATLLMLSLPLNPLRPGLRLQAAPTRQAPPRDLTRRHALPEFPRGAARRRRHRRQRLRQRPAWRIRQGSAHRLGAARAGRRRDRRRAAALRRPGGAGWRHRRSPPAAHGIPGNGAALTGRIVPEPLARPLAFTKKVLAGCCRGSQRRSGSSNREALNGQTEGIPESRFALRHAAARGGAALGCPAWRAASRAPVVRPAPPGRTPARASSSEPGRRSRRQRRRTRRSRA